MCFEKLLVWYEGHGLQARLPGSSLAPLDPLCLSFLLMKWAVANAEQMPRQEVCPVSEKCAAVLASSPPQHQLLTWLSAPAQLPPPCEEPAHSDHD